MTKATTEIRRMRSEDAAGMQHVHTCAVRETCARHVPPEVVAAWLHGRTPEGYRRAADEGGERFWVAIRSKHELVGFASWREDELASLFVHPSMQGCGIGRALYNACATDADAHGWMIVKVRSTLNAEGFYGRLGFRRVGEGYKEKRGRRIPEIRMERDPVAI